MQRGMRWSPDQKESFLATALPSLHAFAETVGGKVRDVDARFDFQLPDVKDPAGHLALIGWTVDVSVVPYLRGRPPEKCAFLFEPMKGRLQAIIRLPS